MPAPHVNHLIAALSRKDRRHLLAGCEQIQLVFADVLDQPGEPIRYIYFPTDSYISMVKPIDSHAGLEVALVGDEGMHGIDLVLGVNVSPLHALVQGAGFALRMAAVPFRRELQHSPALRQVLNRYIHVRMNQLAQTAACTRFHLVEDLIHARRMVKSAVV